MSGWLETSEVTAKWDAITVTEDGVSGAEFVEAAKTIIGVFDLVLGSASGLLKGDMLGNATTVGKHLQATGLPTIQKLVEAELPTKELKKLVGDGKTATCAVLWLTRALFFILHMLEKLCDDSKPKVSEAVGHGYENSLKPHHGMIVKGTFSVASKAAPSREKLISLLGASEEDVVAKLQKILPKFTEVLGANKAFLVAKGVSKESPF